MTEWDKMFWAVKEISRSSRSVHEGLKRIVFFARSISNQYDDPEYWDQVEFQLFQLPGAEIVEWSKAGLEEVKVGKGWDALILDLGDCPETFNLQTYGFGAQFDEGKFNRVISSKQAIHYQEFAECYPDTVANPKDALNTLYFTGNNRTELVYRNVTSLNDGILSWNQSGSFDFHGDNGYLLWLAIGSLALIEALREANYCREILAGRDRLYLLSGFEEIFFHLDTVTAEGLTYNRHHASPNLSLF